MTQVSPFLVVVFVFLFVFGFLVGLVNSCSSGIPEEHGSPRSCLSTHSLDTVEDVVVGEVDELEEDVGRSISCLEGVMDVWRKQA